MRKGKSLYTGPVEGMSASHGFFTLQSEDINRLKEVLKHHPDVHSVQIVRDSVLFYPDKNLTEAELNKYLFEKGVVLSHLVKRKESLEEQFLKLTQQN